MTFSARQPRRLSATVRDGFFDQCAFGDVNHGGSLSPKAGTGQFQTFIREISKTFA
ncbi:hypothetical protein [Paraburkholderia elongata]|uniref:hypothetical protein n=1 Tax=Paraburkholderia elongata TaxID=2675747 RepID=UPI0015553339|nr:hypothetical protein [Paraburkholderia elongata]